MVGARKSRNPQSPWTILLGVLCIALVLFTGIVAAAHTHDQGDVSHADCSLCATAHVTVHIAQPPVILLAALVEARVLPAVPAARPRTLARFALFIRPPPVDALLS